MRSGADHRFCGLPGQADNRLASGRPFVTADERLANVLASRFPVRWLGAYVKAEP